MAQPSSDEFFFMEVTERQEGRPAAPQGGRAVGSFREGHKEAEGS